MISTLKDWITGFSGEDLTILKRCDKKFQDKFAAVGVFVLIIYCTCFTSCSYAIYSFFDHSWTLSIAIGVFFGWMVGNIYLLLLYTLTPNLLVDKDPAFEIFSFILRIGFIILLSIIISRPLSVLLFDSGIEEHITNKKKEMLIQHSVVADSSLISRELEVYGQIVSSSKLNDSKADINDIVVKKVLSDSEYLHHLLSLVDQKSNFQNIDARRNQLFLIVQENKINDKEFLEQFNIQTRVSDSASKRFYSLVFSLVAQRVDSYNSLENILQNNNFFVYKVRKIWSLNPFAWIVDFLMVIVFLLPIYWKYIERKLTRYYAIRKRIEKRIVIDEYEAFKVNYTNALKIVTGKDISFYEPFQDPPFNTIRKTVKANLKSEEDLLKELYAMD